VIWASSSLMPFRKSRKALLRVLLSQKNLRKGERVFDLGDNIFYGHNLTEFLKEAALMNDAGLSLVIMSGIPAVTE